MKFLTRTALFLFVALFLISSSFADDKKTLARDKKSDSSNPSGVNSPAQPASGPSSNSDATTSGAADAATGKTTGAVAPASPAPAPSPKAAAATYDEAPRFTPMPALSGAPGLFTLETGDLLPKGGFNLELGANKFSRMPGDITVLQVGPSFGYGITRWLTATLQVNADEHIHVDQPTLLSLNPPANANPQYRNTIYTSFLPGTGLAPAYVEDYPFASVNGGGIGELDLGIKIGLLSEKRGKPVSLSVRNDFFIPTTTGLSSLLSNEVQYGKFEYGIGLEASKTIFHGAIIATLNWSYRFMRESSYTVSTGSTPEVQTLSLADQMRVGFGMLIFPQKRFQIISEYNGLIYIGKGIQTTTFGARDPVDSITGIRIYPWSRLAIDLGYRYILNLTNHQDRNGFVVKLGAAYWPEKPHVPDALTSSCSVDRSSVTEGSDDPVQASANATDAYNHPLTYTWTSTGGRMIGSGPYSRWDSTGVAPGKYTLNLRLDDGAGNTSSCSASVSVQPKPAPPAPTMSCSVDHPSVLAGERPQITASVSDQSGTPLKYSWQSNGGQIIGDGASVQLDTSGLAPGTYTVTGRVDNTAGGAADCSSAITVQAPPPTPEAAKVGACSYKPGSARNDNVCDRVLDDVAIRLQSEPKGKVVLVGFADPKEAGAAKLAAQRADNAKKYLDAKKGVDSARVEVRSSNGSSAEARENRRLDVVWVPDGATY